MYISFCALTKLGSAQLAPRSKLAPSFLKGVFTHFCVIRHIKWICAVNTAWIYRSTGEIGLILFFVIRNNLSDFVNRPLKNCPLGTYPCCKATHSLTPKSFLIVHVNVLMALERPNDKLRRKIRNSYNETIDEPNWAVFSMSSTNWYLERP
jgi:hypothetical protein